LGINFIKCGFPKFIPIQLYFFNVALPADVIGTKSA